MAGRLSGKRVFFFVVGLGFGAVIAAAFIAEGDDVVATVLDGGKRKTLKTD